jgi:hypothetical protein
MVPADCLNGRLVDAVVAGSGGAVAACGAAPGCDFLNATMTNLSDCCTAGFFKGIAALGRARPSLARGGAAILKVLIFI